MQAEQYKIVTCEDTDSSPAANPSQEHSSHPTAAALLREIDAMLHIHHNDPQQPAVCVMIQSSMYTLISDKLKKAKVADVLLITSSMERKSVAPSSTTNHKYLPWDVVRHFNDLSEKEKKVVSSFTGDYNGIERLRKWKNNERSWAHQSDDAMSSVSTSLSGGETGNKLRRDSGCAESVSGSAQSDDFSRSGFLLADSKRLVPSTSHSVSKQVSKSSDTSNDKPSRATVSSINSQSFPYCKTIRVSRFSMAVSDKYWHCDDEYE